MNADNFNNVNCKSNTLYTSIINHATYKYKFENRCVCFHNRNNTNSYMILWRNT